MIPPDTKVLGVSSKRRDLLCEPGSGVSKTGTGVDPEVAIYAIVNSVIQGGGASQVQILVNGETDLSYMRPCDTSQPLTRRSGYRGGRVRHRPLFRVPGLVSVFLWRRRSEGRGGFGHFALPAGNLRRGADRSGSRPGYQTGRKRRISRSYTKRKFCTIEETARSKNPDSWFMKKPEYRCHRQPGLWWRERHCPLSIRPQSGRF